MVGYLYYVTSEAVKNGACPADLMCSAAEMDSYATNNPAVKHNMLSEAKGGANGVSEDVPTEVTIDGSKHPEAARHAADAQKAGKPDTLTVDRGGARDRRRGAMGGTKPTKGKDRDEYPPAVTKEGGKGASVRPISPKDNRGAGASIGNQIKKVPNGGKIKIKIELF